MGKEIDDVLNKLYELSKDDDSGSIKKLYDILKEASKKKMSRDDLSYLCEDALKVAKLNGVKEEVLRTAGTTIEVALNLFFLV
jgi:O-phosphoseryl-tRNA(Cys) synthetase